ncbi:MAG: hypothetical protein KJO07_15720, partial [Deltaproteobacteria bacterium]|nr:hypothetical protein [Deltaproteobacteria bacterium]
MLVRFNGQGGETASRVVSKTPSYFGGKLAIGIPVPRDGGGMFLVATDGYYITLGPELERLDPLGVVDHLRARGSQNPDWDEVEHLY